MKRSRRLLAVGGAIVLTLIVGFVPAPSRVDAQPAVSVPPNQIVNVLRFRCLSVRVYEDAKDFIAPNMGVELRACESRPALYQLWHLQQVPGNRYRYRIAAWNGYEFSCLVPKGQGSSDGQDVVIVRCGDRPLLWSWENWTLMNRMFVSQTTKQCLDADTNTINDDRTRVQLWTCNGLFQQVWALKADPATA